MVLYGGAITTALIFSLYLLLCKGKAIAPHITPPVRLRRWAAALFGIIALGHIWWLFAFFFCGSNPMWVYVPFTLLDCVTLTIAVAGTLLSMLALRGRNGEDAVQDCADALLAYARRFPEHRALADRLAAEFQSGAILDFYR
jgi:hypothetical protein